jgi:hypothetical protein
MKRAWLLGLLIGCGPSGYERETLLDPQTCKSCHPDHYREWSGSMHAYAADDPVFLAMNQKGQRETNGALGDFCVKCHAPMAVREGATTDGLNLAEVPRPLKGVTCFFCHTVEAIEGDHNNPLVLSEDPIMRGAIGDPVDNEAHEAEYSALHDRTSPQSATLCGPCHDIVNPNGVPIERTYTEWKGSLYAHDTPRELQTCGRCHMAGRDGLAAEYPGVKSRRVTNHMMAAVDVALTSWPEIDAQTQEVQRLLDPTLFNQICVTRVAGGLEVEIDLENFAAGHAFPSGSTSDRRVWVELVASLEGQPTFESGVVADGDRLVDLVDPNLLRLGDRFYDGDGNEVHDFWKAARYEGQLLIAPTAIPPDPRYVNPHFKKKYTVPGLADRIVMRVRVQPIGLDVLDELIASGDLDPVIRARMPTFDLAASRVEWSTDLGEGCFPEI